MRPVSRHTPLLLLLMAGCASPSPDLYSLEPQPGTVQARPVPANVRTGVQPVIVVRGVGLPRYLEREEIVRAAGGTRLYVAGNEWWGEPLRVMLRRVLVANLAQRLPDADVLADEGPIAAHADAEVDVEVQRFDRDAGDGDPGAPVRFDGYAAISHASTPGLGQPRTLERLRFEVPVAADTTKAQVGAMSTAMGQVADAVAGRLARP